MRKPRPLDDSDAGQELQQDRPHRRRTEQQRFFAAAKMQDAIGEDMAALEITGELHLVDRDEGSLGLARHRFDGADGKTRIGRRNLFFAGDQRHILRADLLHYPRIDLARQQPERQADHAGPVSDHALDGIMGLAGIGRPEHRGHTAPTQNHRLRSQSHESMQMRRVAPGKSRLLDGSQRTHGQLPPQTQGQISKCLGDCDLCESRGTPEFPIRNSVRTDQRQIGDSS